ncbi:sugar kinase [Streptomyces sp. NPDC093094]|uniref:sugar kinase n=1 Tax=Streptomyces sp. NPDC093094 TaxID=3366026 RepID=UPI0037F2A5B3
MTATGPTPDVVDVVALGESMVTFLPARVGRLADVPEFLRGIGGAESNVACALAAAGHTARWVSRVGADGFGDHLVETVAAYGVDVSAVRRDPDRPTGVYFRTAGERGTEAHEVAYYRAGSAASAMSVANLDLDAVRSARVLHLSGITAALSGECLALLRELTAARADRPLVSFDVNYRPGLWPDPARTGVLLELARGADIVFVGADEARDAWGMPDTGPLLSALTGPALVVVKQGADGATAYGREAGGVTVCGREAGGVTVCGREAGGRPPAAGRGGPAAPARRTPGGEHGPAPLRASAPEVDVVAAVGAGDAFAAGFLSATLRGLPVRDRLRHGHLWAAAVLTEAGDLAAPPARGHADRLAALDDAAWGRLRLGPGWTRAGEALEEVRTP